MKLQDLTGQRFGRLTVIKRAENKISPKGHQTTMWLCRCDCGNKVERSAPNLKNVEVPSCGCYTKELVSKIRVHDLTGQRFGKLVVLEVDGKQLVKVVAWYDNEMGYSAQMVRTAEALAKSINKN